MMSSLNFIIYFISLFCLILSGTLLADGKILKVNISERLKESVQVEMVIGPREASEENDYRKKINADVLMVDENSDEKKLILWAKHLSWAGGSLSALESIGFVETVDAKLVTGSFKMGEPRVDAQGREYQSSSWTFVGKGQLRMGEVETYEEVGRPIKLRFWLHLEEKSEFSPSPTGDWKKYTTVSRRAADRPFPTLALSLEMKERRQQLLRQIASLPDSGYVTAIHGLIHMSSEEAISMVTNQLSPDGSIKAALGRDQLVITDRKDYVLNIVQTLEALDHQPPEVSIEVKIVEINRGSGSDIGVDWSGSKDGRYGGQLNGSFLDGVAENVMGHTSAAGMVQGVLAKGTDQLTMKISALLEMGMAKVMSEPKLLVANRSEGNFKMTESVPIMVRKKITIQDTRQNNGSWENSDTLGNTARDTTSHTDLTFPNNAITDTFYNNLRNSTHAQNQQEAYAELLRTLSQKNTQSNLDKVVQSDIYEEVLLETGITLKVTPRIHQSGVIELSLNPKITELSNRASATDTPIIATREIDTKAYVQDGETLVLGGLIYEKTVIDRGSVPLLSKIPGLGNLFKREKRRKESRELLFLVKTTIVQL
jgi:Flp pilus assembly secretin CpaC